MSEPEQEYEFFHTLYPELHAELKAKYGSNLVILFWPKGSPRAADWPKIGSKSDPIPVLMRAAFEGGYIAGQLAAGKTPDDLEKEYQESLKTDAKSNAGNHPIRE